jgi:hypothetical protein
MNHYLCTRNLPYENPACEGYYSLKARKTHIISANSPVEAMLEMAIRFPRDVQRVLPKDAFTVSSIPNKRIVNHLMLKEYLNRELPTC